MMKRSVKNPAAIVSLIILAAFLLIGLSIFRDYGSSNDELNQVEAGHITWKFLYQKFGVPVPESISGAPELQEYFNRYYGQAATFPTVIAEAVREFKLDMLFRCFALSFISKALVCTCRAAFHDPAAENFRGHFL
jgi:hypothetical protein